jgi:hypothetical protein
MKERIRVKPSNHFEHIRRAAAHRIEQNQLCSRRFVCW